MLEKHDKKKRIYPYISLTRPRTAVKLYAHTYCTHMRGIRDKTDFCCDYSWIEDLFLFRIWIVITHQELQQRRAKQFLMRYAIDKILLQTKINKEKARENMTMSLRKVAI